MEDIIENILDEIEELYQSLPRYNRYDKEYYAYDIERLENALNTARLGIRRFKERYNKIPH